MRNRRGGYLGASTVVGRGSDWYARSRGNFVPPSEPHPENAELVRKHRRSREIREQRAFHMLKDDIRALNKLKRLRRKDPEAFRKEVDRLWDKYVRRGN